MPLHRRWPRIFSRWLYRWELSVKLWNDQSALVAGIGELFREVLRVLAVAPCAFGKTICFCYIALRSSAKGKLICIIVHRVELLDQVCRALGMFGVSYGVIAAGRTENPKALVQVASVQTLAKRLGRWPRFDMLICDEAHHAVAASWATIIRHYPKAYVLGVTATPQRADGRGLNEFFDRMIEGPSVAELIAAGRLSHAVVYAPKDPVDLNSVHTRMGDYDKKELGAVMGQSVVVGDAVAHYKRLAPGELAIAFCVSVRHAEEVAAQFRDGGVPSQSIDGAMDPVERKRTLARFEAGEIKVLTSCDLVSEGYDLPAASCAILLRPTKSLALAIQQMGRALRVSPGKTRALILDHANLTMMHGLPDEPREWSLEGAKKRKKKAEDSGPPVRQCGLCYAISRASAKTCSACGEPFERKPRQIEHIDGDLEEVDPAELRRSRKREEGQADSYEALAALGRARGYAAGWARIRWKARMAKRGVSA